MKTYHVINQSDNSSFFIKSSHRPMIHEIIVHKSIKHRVHSIMHLETGEMVLLTSIA